MFQKKRMEPPDTQDIPIIITSSQQCIHHPIHDDHYDDDNDIRHPSKVPAAGRGNSQDGKYWINPSANQLLNACKRKNKQLIFNHYFL